MHKTTKKTTHTSLTISDVPISDSESEEEFEDGRKDGESGEEFEDGRKEARDDDDMTDHREGEGDQIYDLDAELLEYVSPKQDKFKRKQNITNNLRHDEHNTSMLRDQEGKQLTSAAQETASVFGKDLNVANVPYMCLLNKKFKQDVVILTLQTSRCLDGSIMITEVPIPAHMMVLAPHCNKLRDMFLSNAFSLKHWQNRPSPLTEETLTGFFNLDSSFMCDNDARYPQSAITLIDKHFSEKHTYVVDATITGGFKYNVWRPNDVESSFVVIDLREYSLRASRLALLMIYSLPCLDTTAASGALLMLKMLPTKLLLECCLIGWYLDCRYIVQACAYYVQESLDTTTFVSRTDTKTQFNLMHNTIRPILLTCNMLRDPLYSQLYNRSEVQAAMTKSREFLSRIIAANLEYFFGFQEVLQAIDADMMIKIARTDVMNLSETELMLYILRWLSVHVEFHLPHTEEPLETEEEKTIYKELDAMETTSSSSSSSSSVPVAITESIPVPSKLESGTITADDQCVKERTHSEDGKELLPLGCVLGLHCKAPNWLVGYPGSGGETTRTQPDPIMAAIPHDKLRITRNVAPKYELISHVHYIRIRGSHTLRCDIRTAIETHSKSPYWHVCETTGDLYVGFSLRTDRSDLYQFLLDNPSNLKALNGLEFAVVSDTKINHKHYNTVCLAKDHAIVGHTEDMVSFKCRDSDETICGLPISAFTDSDVADPLFASVYTGTTSVALWDSGVPHEQFLYGDICYLAIHKPSDRHTVNTKWVYGEFVCDDEEGHTGKDHICTNPVEVITLYNPLPTDTGPPAHHPKPACRTHYVGFSNAKARALAYEKFEKKLTQLNGIMVMVLNDPRKTPAMAIPVTPIACENWTTPIQFKRTLDVEGIRKLIKEIDVEHVDFTKPEVLRLFYLVRWTQMDKTELRVWLDLLMEEFVQGDKPHITKEEQEQKDIENVMAPLSPILDESPWLIHMPLCNIPPNTKKGVVRTRLRILPDRISLSNVPWNKCVFFIYHTKAGQHDILWLLRHLRDCLDNTKRFTWCIVMKPVIDDKLKTLKILMRFTKKKDAKEAIIEIKKPKLFRLGCDARRMSDMTSENHRVLMKRVMDAHSPVLAFGLYEESVAPGDHWSDKPCDTADYEYESHTQKIKITVPSQRTPATVTPLTESDEDEKKKYSYEQLIKKKTSAPIPQSSIGVEEVKSRCVIVSNLTAKTYTTWQIIQHLGFGLPEQVCYNIPPGYTHTIYLKYPTEITEEQCRKATSGRLSSHDGLFSYSPDVYLNYGTLNNLPNVTDYTPPPPHKKIKDLSTASVPVMMVSGDELVLPSEKRMVLSAAGIPLSVSVIDVVKNIQCGYPLKILVCHLPIQHDTYSLVLYYESELTVIPSYSPLGGQFTVTTIVDEQFTNIAISAGQTHVSDEYHMFTYRNVYGDTPHTTKTESSTSSSSAPSSVSSKETKEEPCTHIIVKNYRSGSTTWQIIQHLGFGFPDRVCIPLESEDLTEAEHSVILRYRTVITKEECSKASSCTLFGYRLFDVTLYHGNVSSSFTDVYDYEPMAAHHPGVTNKRKKNVTIWTTTGDDCVPKHPRFVLYAYEIPGDMSIAEVVNHIGLAYPLKITTERADRKGKYAAILNYESKYTRNVPLTTKFDLSEISRLHDPETIHHMELSFLISEEYASYTFRNLSSLCESDTCESIAVDLDEFRSTKKQCVEQILHSQKIVRDLPFPSPLRARLVKLICEHLVHYTPTPNLPTGAFMDSQRKPNGSGTNVERIDHEAALMNIIGGIYHVGKENTAIKNEIKDTFTPRKLTEKLRVFNREKLEKHMKTQPKVDVI